MGKVNAGAPETGDTVAGFTVDELNPSPTAVAAFFEAVPQNVAATRVWRGQARRWLGKATARFVYHFGEHYEFGVTTWGHTAAGACSIVREKHERDVANADVDMQVAFEYSDGAGQTFVKKVQAEPDPADRRRPRALDRQRQDDRQQQGQAGPAVRAVLLVERPPLRRARRRSRRHRRSCSTTPPGRLVRTEFPDGTLSRVEFSPWFSRSFDQNDTVLELSNRWYADPHRSQMLTPTTKRAARLAALHANTPAEVHFDSLGRDVIAIAHNRTPDDRRNNTSLIDRPWPDERILTFTKLDAEGKPLWICDARGNLVMQYITPPKPDHTALYDDARSQPPSRPTTCRRTRARATTSPAICSSSTAWTPATAGC